MGQEVFNIYSKIYINSAQKNGFQVKILDPSGLIQFKKNNKVFLINRCILPCNNSVATSIAASKDLTAQLLGEQNIPVSKQEIIEEEKDLNRRKIEFPVTVKPAKGIGGKGVSTLINDYSSLKKAFLLAQKYYHKVIIEGYQKGVNYRLLVVGDKVIACCRRLPAKITGDGKKTVEELISSENVLREKINKKKKNKVLEKIKIDFEVKRVLAKNNLTFKSILPSSKEFFLRENANLSTGGVVESLDKTLFHPSFFKNAVKAVKTIGLKIAGIDIIAQDIKKPCLKPNAIIIEINHNPGIRMHHFPSLGKSVDVASYILNYLLENL